MFTASLSALALVLALVAGAPTPPRESAAGTEWEWPIEGRREVIAEYRAPATRYGAGHRGLDLATLPGVPVLAPADGVVAFAGTVVDRPLISIDHTDGLRSTLEPVQPLVAAGDVVARGQPIGTVATGGHCATRCLHLGARLHGDYINPRLLLGTVPRAVLLPSATASTPIRSTPANPRPARTTSTTSLHAGPPPCPSRPPTTSLRAVAPTPPFQRAHHFAPRRPPTTSLCAGHPPPRSTQGADAGGKRRAVRLGGGRRGRWRGGVPP
ncbi:murein hydrolase activator EnvC [Herbiconiux sp. P15]|uniref:murein hydrolase activator EnvC family protein n=1 Tax=Herbiconiux liukaitaii TaxID=3342799 RepID=UPI0035B7F68E